MPGSDDRVYLLDNSALEERPHNEDARRHRTTHAVDRGTGLRRVRGTALAEAEAVFVAGALPRFGRLALWHLNGVPDAPAGADTTVDDVELVVRAGRAMRSRTLSVRMLDMPSALRWLTELSPGDTPTPSVVAWAVTFRMGLDLVARGRLHPLATPNGFDAWHVGPLDPTDEARLVALTDWFPPEAHAIRMRDASVLRVIDAASLIRESWDAIADVLVRTPAAPLIVSSRAWSAVEPTDVSGAGEWLDSLDGSDGDTARPGLRLEMAPDGAAARAVVQLREPRRSLARGRRRRVVGRARRGAGSVRRTGRDRFAPRTSAWWSCVAPARSDARRCASVRRRPRRRGDRAAARTGGGGVGGGRFRGAVAGRADPLESRAPCRGANPGARERGGGRSRPRRVVRVPLGGHASTARCSPKPSWTRWRRRSVRSCCVRGRWVVADPSLLDRLRRRSGRVRVADALAARAGGNPDRRRRGDDRRRRGFAGDTRRSPARARDSTASSPNPTGSTRHSVRTNGGVWRGSPRCARSVSGVASPTTWASARRSSSSLSTCTGTRPNPASAPHWSSARRRCSATGSGNCNDSRRRSRCAATTAVIGTSTTLRSTRWCS